MPETSASRAYTVLQKSFWEVASDVPESARREFLAQLSSQLTAVQSETERATRTEIADYLDKLAEGRMDYVGREPTHAGAIEQLGGMRATVYGEATGARWLARIIRGEIDDKGWLPSWRWTR